MGVHFLPQGYHSVTPYLIVRGAAAALDFYRQALGATELMRFGKPGGIVGHAEFQVGDSRIMLADEMPEYGALSPQSVGGTAVGLCVYLPDVDAAAERFVAAGGKTLMGVQDMFYGDRSGTFLDPFGHKWTLATHIEDIAPEELQKRAAAMFG